MPSAPRAPAVFPWAVGLLALLPITTARAQVSAATAGQADEAISITKPRISAHTADLGPLGAARILDTPFSISVVPHAVIENQQARNLSDLMRYIPSVQIEARGGANLGRPQSRGFESDVVSNTRIDGLNAVETTPYPAEQLDSLQVLNGLAGALYGPQNPAGIFEYQLKRPTDAPLRSAFVGYDSQSVFTEGADVAGRAGRNGWFGYRLNLVHGDGTAYVDHSNIARNLIAGDFDIHLSSNDTIEIDASHYVYHERGTPPTFGFGTSILLPNAPDVSKPYYGQDYAGFNTETNTGLARIIHRFSDDWSVTAGGLYQVADRSVFANADTFLNNAGVYSSTIAAAATAKRFIVGSNALYLNGHERIWNTGNDLVLGTNGYRMGNYNPTAAQTLALGTASLASPQPFTGYQPRASGTYMSAFAEQQALVAADTIHLDRHWAVMGVFSWSWLSSTSYNARQTVTANSHRDGAFSPTASLIYKPADDQTVYFTYANSLQMGDTAPATVVNANQILAPYRSEEYELGYKIQLRDGLLLTTDIFCITRPFGFTDPVTNVFAANGTQRNYGGEFYASGLVRPGLYVLGGVTLLDPQLGDTGTAATSDKEVVGVPPVQANALVDYTLPARFGLGGLAVNASLHYAARRAANVYNTAYASGYTTLDLGLRKPFEIEKRKLVFRLEVDNVTNARYWASIYPNSVNGATGTNTASAGLPRTVQGTLQVDF